MFVLILIYGGEMHDRQSALLANKTLVGRTMFGLLYTLLVHDRFWRLKGYGVSGLFESWPEINPPTNGDYSDVYLERMPHLDEPCAHTL